MCESVTGERFRILRPITAWKVCVDQGESGPFHPTQFIPGSGWAKPVRPEAFSGSISGSSLGVTTKGYHVFEHKEGAEAYLQGLYSSMYGRREELTVQKVLVVGDAIPFGNYGHAGFAVETWKPVIEVEDCLEFRRRKV